MFSSRGIAVDSWARIEGDCPITCTVVGSEAEFEFGDFTHALHLVIEDEALRKLSDVIAEAVSQLSQPVQADQ